MSKIIQELEAEQMGKSTLPDFGPGDTLVVQVKVKEGERERLQAFEGVCVAKRNRGLNSSFTVRKISHGGVWSACSSPTARTWSMSRVKRRGDVRRAKLYYLRGSGPARPRIKERSESSSSSRPEVGVQKPPRPFAAVFFRVFGGLSGGRLGRQQHPQLPIDRDGRQRPAVDQFGGAKGRRWVDRPVTSRPG